MNIGGENKQRRRLVRKWLNSNLDCWPVEHSAGESAADHRRFNGDDLENEQCFVTTNESTDWLKEASKWSNGSSMPVIILPHKKISFMKQQNEYV